MLNLFKDITFLACICSGLAVVFATFVIINFITESSAKYRERYIRETAVEYDDILLSMPAGRIFDLSLALAAFGVFLSVGILWFISSDLTPVKITASAIIGALIAFPAPRMILKYLKKRRLQKFNEQLEDALLSISSSLKAGFSIIQALDLIASENRSPISYEFTIMTQELRLGVHFEDAMEKMSKRVGSQDFDLVMTAIVTARQTGGELTGVLERLAAVIRERVRIQQKLDAMTAQGRMQAKLIGAMPFILLFAMTHTPVGADLTDAFFDSFFGWIILALSTILVAIGFLVIRKITTIDI